MKWAVVPFHLPVPACSLAAATVTTTISNQLVLVYPPPTPAH
jgi:hypothetical protein